MWVLVVPASPEAPQGQGAKPGVLAGWQREPVFPSSPQVTWHEGPESPAGPRGFRVGSSG